MTDDGGAPAAMEPAWVLHRRNYRDSSLIVELLTRDSGRVGAVARGARAPRSRWRGVLEPFQAVWVLWRGRGELATLTGAEGRGPVLHLPGPRVASAFYGSELVLRLVRRQEPVEPVFHAYGALLQALASGAPEGAALRLYEKRLLAALGYGLLLDATADSGDPVRPDGYYRYDLEHGPVPVADAGAGGLVVPGSALLALEREELDSEPEAVRTLQRLTGAALRLYIGDRPLRSRALYASLRRRGSTGEGS